MWGDDEGGEVVGDGGVVGGRVDCVDRCKEGQCVLGREGVLGYSPAMVDAVLSSSSGWLRYHWRGHVVSQPPPIDFSTLTASTQYLSLSLCFPVSPSVLFCPPRTP